MHAVDTAFAQDLGAHAIGAQVHAATLGRLRRTRLAFELRQQLVGGLAAVEQHRYPLALFGDIAQAGLERPGVHRAADLERVEHRQRLVHAHWHYILSVPTRP